MDIEEQKEELLEYAEIDDDSYSAACIALCQFHDHAGNLAYDGNDLNGEVEEAITKNLQWYKENMVIKEQTTTITRTIRYLARR